MGITRAAIKWSGDARGRTSPRWWLQIAITDWRVRRTPSVWPDLPWWWHCRRSRPVLIRWSSWCSDRWQCHWFDQRGASLGPPARSTSTWSRWCYWWCSPDRSGRSREPASNPCRWYGHQNWRYHKRHPIGLCHSTPVRTRCWWWWSPIAACRHWSQWRWNFNVEPLMLLVM